MKLASHFSYSTTWTAYKEGLRTNSKYLDCLWGELYGSINVAQGMITPEHADYLRKKYLFE